MNETIDYDRISNAALNYSEQLMSMLFPSGSILGREFRIGSLAGEKGNSLSINLDSGLWCDFSSGDSGRNLITVWAAAKDIKNSEAAIEIDKLIHSGGVTSESVVDSVASIKKQKKPAADVWRAIIGSKVKGSPPKTKRVFREDKWESHRITASWTYKTSGGALVGYICRIDYKDGSKECFPYTFCKNDETGEFAWRWKRFKVQRPLYNGQKIFELKKNVAFIVEGEKTAEAVQQIWPSVPVITWPGGTVAIKTAINDIDWTPLEGLRVTLFPDADSQTDKYGNILPEAEQPGMAAMIAIEKHISPIAESTFICRPPDEWRGGYDLADAIADGWDRNMIASFIKRRKDESENKPVSVTEEMEADAAVAAMSADEIEGDEIEITAGSDIAAIIDQFDVPDDLLEQQAASDSEALGYVPDKDLYKIKDAPFSIYGVDGVMGYFRKRGDDLIEVNLTKLTDQVLLNLAPLEYWKRTFPKGAFKLGQIAIQQLKHDDVDWKSAFDRVRDAAYDAGYYAEWKCRGRGFWLDDDNHVLNTGTGLVVNGAAMPFNDFHSKYVYEFVAPGAESEFSMNDDVGAPMLKNEQASKVLDLCKSLEFSNPISAYFLAGWIALAPLSGILEWRPHIWISGSRGCGKSYILNNVIRPLLGSQRLDNSTGLTVAGMTQKLRNDAIPVVFDESESNTRQGAERIDGLLEVIRASSVGKSTAITKGSVTGKTRSFTPRFTTCLASINVAAVNAADTSRITRLDLRERTDEQNRVKFHGPGGTLELIKATAADSEFCASFRARQYYLAKVIKASADVFRDAMARHCGDQRQGDQSGTLLAGAWSLCSSRVPTKEEAEKWIKERDWSVLKIANAESDESNALDVLLASTTRTEVGGSFEDVNIVSLLTHVFSADSTVDIKELNAYKTLLRCGIKPVIEGKERYFHVSTKRDHPYLSRIYKGTMFEGKWKDPLLRMEGAKDSNVTFYQKTKTRAVSIMADCLAEESPE